MKRKNKYSDKEAKEILTEAQEQVNQVQANVDKFMEKMVTAGLLLKRVHNGNDQIAFAPGFEELKLSDKIRMIESSGMFNDFEIGQAAFLLPAISAAPTISSEHLM